MHMQTVRLAISGMSCGGCARSVGNVLNALDGVTKAEVSLDQHCAVVDYDPGKVSVDQLRQAIEEAGYEITR
jgi:copper chaperone